MLKAKYLCLFCLLLTPQLWAQELLFTGSPIYLDLSRDLPEDLLATKTAVIVDAGNSGLDWKEISKEAHVQLRRTGIDGIAYFRWDELFSGFEPQYEIAGFLNTRQVQNLILIKTQKGIAEVWLTGFNGQWTFIENSQKAWYNQDSTISRTLLPLYQKAALELEKSNLLISDFPEYYENLYFHNQKIERIYPPNVKSFKTCVSQMPAKGKPEGMPERVSKAYNLYYDAMVSRNNQIRDLIGSSYPFQNTMFDLGPDPSTLKLQEGCNFYLGYVYGKAIDIASMFGVPSGNTREVTINSVLSDKPMVRYISSSRNIFKFYLKNSITGDIFIGSGWDADVTIEDALSNFIFYLKKDLKVNP